MKIETVESLIAGGSQYVRITTDDGTTGIGQSGCWAYPEAVDGVLQHFRGYLVGQDPLRIEHHWQHLYRMGPFRGSVAQRCGQRRRHRPLGHQGQALRRPGLGAPGRHAAETGSASTCCWKPAAPPT